jgi:hypothetical protein
MSIKNILPLVAGFLDIGDAHKTAVAAKLSRVDIIKQNIFEQFSDGYLSPRERKACYNLKSDMVLPNSLALRVFKKDFLRQHIKGDPILDGRTKARLLLFIDRRTPDFDSVFRWYMSEVYEGAFRIPLLKHVVNRMTLTIRAAGESVLCVLNLFMFVLTRRGVRISCTKSGCPLAYIDSTTSTATITQRAYHIPSLISLLSSDFVFQTCTALDKFKRKNPLI